MSSQVQATQTWRISDQGDESDVSKPNYFGKEYFAEKGFRDVPKTL
jgi:hypothetical protein